MYFMGLSKADKKKLETEVVSNEARLKLTRLVRKACQSNDSNVNLIQRNRFINAARTVLGLPIHRLEPDDMGMYMNEEFGWHLAETELVMRRPDTAQLAEIIGDMVQERMLDLGEVNGVLAEDNSSMRLVAEGFDDDISVNVLSEVEIEEKGDEADHPNIRVLVQRMESTFEQKDYAGTLHASATVFETLAKLVFNNPNVENQTLGGMFEGYRNRSELPEPLLDYILGMYNRRSSEPLAAHGATKAPTLTARDASILVEMTKMCVRLERRLAVQEVDMVPAATTATAKASAGGVPSAPPAAAAAKPSKPSKPKIRAKAKKKDASKS